MWLATLRVTSVVDPALRAHDGQPWALALWHGQILPLLAFRRRRKTAAMVSLSADGEVLTWAFKVLGVGAVRGSSSRNGRAALQGLVRLMSEGWDSAFAVDGPRGPRRVARPGALAAAARSGGIVVPWAAACSRSFRLGASWDHFELPWPFSRVAIVMGPPANGSDAEGLSRALDEACARATRCLIDTKELIGCLHTSS